MKIIKETDFRYKNLPKLWEKWNFDNFKIPLSRQYRYVIPHELRLDGGEDFFIGRSAIFIERYLGLELQEYFDLMVLHINDTDDRPKCKNCGAYICFSGELARGYARHHWENVRNLFCDKSCRQYYIHSHLEEYPHEVERRKSWTQSVSLNDMRQARSAMNRELNHGDHLDLIYFYRGRLDDNWLKYGITEYYPGRNNHLHLKDDEIFQYTRSKACLLEYLIKVKFIELGINDHECVKMENKEIFYKITNEMISYVTELSESQVADKINEINY